MFNFFVVSAKQNELQGRECWGQNHQTIHQVQIIKKLIDRFA